MKRHRPVRAWIGEAHTDPAELCGPRGLVEEVLSASDDDVQPDVSGDDAFFASLMTPERLARIDAVIDARLESVTAEPPRLRRPPHRPAPPPTGRGAQPC